MLRKDVVLDEVRLPLETLDDVDAAAAELCGLATQRETIQAAMQYGYDAIAQERDPELRPIVKRMDALAEAIEDWKEKDRNKKLFSGDQDKTKALLRIVLKAKETQRVELLDGLTEEAVVTRLKEAGRRDLIRVKEEPNLDVIKAARLTPGQLLDFGLTVTEDISISHKLVRPGPGRAAKEPEDRAA